VDIGKEMRGLAMRKWISILLGVLLVIILAVVCHFYLTVRSQLEMAQLDLLVIQKANEILCKEAVEMTDRWRETSRWGQQQMHRADHAEIALYELGYEVKAVSGYYK
jgi:hypothetical protein